MLQSKLWNMEKGYKGTRLQWAQTLGKDQAEAQSNQDKKFFNLPKHERQAKYSQTIRDIPVASDYSVLKVAK